jgi:hypothetical protein
MNLGRICRHLWADNWKLRSAFPKRSLGNIERAIDEEEQRHGGELRFAVEGGLPLASLLRGQTARERAIELFSALRIWDTEANCGVLIYVSLGDRDVEIVADRGINRLVGDAGWQAICDGIRSELKVGQFEYGVIGGIRAVSRLLVEHFPRAADDTDELPNRPLVI